MCVGWGAGRRQPGQRERWRDGGWDAVAPSGMRCRTGQLFAGSARRLSPFSAGSPVCVCEQHLLRRVVC